MKTSTNTLPKSQAEITIELEPTEIKDQLEKAATDLSLGMKISGFRPGKVPYDMVAKKIGEGHIYQHAAERIIQQSFPRAVQEAKIMVVGQPKIDILKSAPNNPFVYKATVSLLPEIKISDYKSISAKKGEAKVKPEEIEKNIDQIRRMRAQNKEVDRAATKGDMVEVDFDVSVDKVKIDGGSSKNHPVMIGDNQFIPGFEDNIVGMLKGQTKEFNISFPKDYHAKHLAGKEATFKVTANKVSEVTMPEFNDQFVKELGDLGNVTTFRKKIEENLQAEAETREERKYEEAIIDELLKKTTFGELPELLINSELDKMIHELKEDTKQRGMEWDQYLDSIKKKEDDLKNELKEQAIKRVRAALIIRQVAQEQNVTVSVPELEAEIKKAREHHQGNAEYLKQLDTPAYKQYLENLLANRKVIQFLKEQVQK